MAISLTCMCGAILEIDDKFRGQRIPCPDCNRLLDTTPPPPPPKATSGWALASVIFSLGGMLTLIGPVVGAACGVIGLREIRRDPKIAGTNFARAGIGLGAFFTVVSLWAFFGTEFLGLDGFFRLYFGATKELKFPEEIVVRGHPLPGEYYVTLKRPSLAWGIRQAANTDATEDLTLVNLWDDAHLIVFGLRLEGDDRPEDCRREAIVAFLNTNLVKSLTKSSDKPPFPPAAQIKVLKEDDKNPRQQEFAVEFSWGTIPRVFLFRLFTQPGKPRVNVVAGGARQSRFDRLEESIRQSLDSCQLEDVK